MSAKAKRRTAWAVVLLIVALLIFLDFSITSAEKQKGDMPTILRNLLYGGSIKSNTIVGVCNSMDPGLNTLQAAVDAEVTYAQVDSITRMSVSRAGGLQNVVEPGDWVVIKPNFLVVPGVTSGTYTWAHNGVTTDLRVIKSVIQQLVEEGDASRITVAEGATWRKNGDPVVPAQTVDGWTYHWPWFGNLSVEDMIAEFNAAYPGKTFDYIDLNYPPYTLTPVPGGGLSQDSYYIPDAILQCDKLIAVAAMKTHSMTRVTLTNKLYVGTSPASVYRSGAFDHLGIPHGSVDGVPNAIERTLIDLMSYHPPDFGIVECFWGTEGSGPLGGNAIQRNLVIAGRDPVAVDAVSAYTMGMNPWDIDHLHWSSAKGFGTNDMRYINTVGPDLNDIRHNFARAKAQGRANRVWLINGTHAGTDLDSDMLDGQETTIDPIEGQTTNGKTWAAFNDIDDYMNLAKEYAYPSSCIVYAFTRIYSDASKSVRLRFGADDGIKIWLNGSVVYTSSGTESYSLVAHDLPITLQPGENRLLVKIRNTSGSYGFSVCVSESGGDTPLGITYDIQSPGAPEVTLNAPVEGATVTDSFVTLSASVSDPDGDSVTVMFYGDTASGASELLYSQKVASGTTVDYTWRARTLEPTTGTFGLWHFDENSGDVLYDATGRGHDGAWHCDSTLSEMWTGNSAFGYALDFFGYHTGTPENPCGADYVEVPDDPDLDVDSTGPLTMEFWIRPDCLPPATGFTCDTARYWGIVNKRIPCVPPQDTVSGCGTAANYCIFYNYATQTIGFYGNTALYVSTCSLTVGEWQYIVVTVNGATGDLRFYKNGTLKQARTGYIGHVVDGPLRIGASAYRRKGVDAQIDEVRLSRRVLSAQEIADNYKLATGTYYWRVVASDGVETTNSPTRSFSVTESGPGEPPEITLNSPANGANTTNNYMHLNATVSVASPTKVWFYGGSTSDPTDLLYARENVTGTQTFDYNWNRNNFDPETGATMGLWHFDEGSGTAVGDESGNVNSGTAIGSPAWSADGRFGYAMDFDGVDDYITIPDAGSLDIDSAAGEITMETWIYPHSSGGGKWGSIISKKAMGGSVVNYQISLDQVTGNLLFYSGHWPQIWISSVSIPLNQWSYVAVTLKATEGRLRFYRNGVLLDSTVTYTGNGGCFGAANSTVLTIGTAGLIAECFDGLIDEARLTNRALSSEEIAANYTDGLAVGTYYWKVAADDGAKTLTESEVRNFYVGSGGAPAIPTLLTPTHLATITDNTPTFTWSATAGVGGTYTLEYSTDQNFGAGPTVTVTDIAATEYTPTTPLSNAVWYWHIQAINGYGSSGYQVTPFSFTVAADADPPVITLNSPADGALTSNPYMDLDFNVSDANPMTVWVYGDTSTSPTDLLSIQQNVASGNIVYNWSAPALRPETGSTMGLWHLDEGSGTTFGDVSGNGNDGSFVAAPTWVTGRFGNALDFDGTTNYVSVPDASSLDVDSITGAVTIEAWIYPHASGGGIYRSFISKRALGATSGPCNYQLSLNGANGNLLFYNGNTLTGIYVSSVSIPLNQWSYVAVSLSAAEKRLRFYRNGVLLDSSITNASFGAANSEALCFGMAARVAECFDGMLDEVRITNRLLSSAEIAGNYMLKEDTYYWKIVASDGANPNTTSETRYFDVGSDDTSPVITLLSPSDGGSTPLNHMVLSARVSDQSLMTVKAYGGITSTAADLLEVWTGAVADTFDFDWAIPPLQPETGRTRGLWHMNEGTGSTVADASGNNNNGTFAGDPVWTADVPLGYGLDLDGTGDFVTVPSASSLNIDPGTGAITMEAWVYPTRTGGGYETIIGKWASSSSINYQMSLHTTSDNLVYYMGSGGSIWTSDVHVPTNEWSYIAITLDAADHVARFYRNGVEGTPISSVNIGSINTGPVTIGATSSSGTETFWGRVDEVRITDRRLSSAEIAANYQLSAGRYYWKFTADDGINPLTTSDVWYFNVGTQPAPDKPVLIYPANAVLTTDNTPSFFWSTAARAETYTLEYARDIAFTTGKVTVAGLTDTSFTPGAALGEGAWYWHVEAVNTGGNSGYQATPFTFTIDTQAPPAPIGFTVQPGHAKVTLGWTNATSDYDHTVVMRSHWYAGGTGYPEYDDNNAEGPYPTDTVAFSKVYSGTGTSYVDNVAERDVYHYTVFTVDAAGNLSAVTTAQKGRATNYWLGDKTEDGQVYYQDLTWLSNAYWTTPASPNWDGEFDIGPTYNGSAKGIPTTDNVVSFEDMIIFAINFNTVNPIAKAVPLLPQSDNAGPLGLALAKPVGAVPTGQEFTVSVVLENNPGSVKGIHCLIPYDKTSLQFVRIDPSPRLTGTEYPFFFDGRERNHQIDLSMAILGADVTIGGSGELATVTFRVLQPLRGQLEYSFVDIRDGDNVTLLSEQKGVDYSDLVIPKEYGLMQNRPNPFNPTTEIMYQIPQAGQVTLKIFNIQGQVVRTLVDGYTEAGFHTIEWNSCDDSGRRVASGMYLYRITAGPYTETKKMVLLK